MGTGDLRVYLGVMVMMCVFLGCLIGDSCAQAYLSQVPLSGSGPNASRPQDKSVSCHILDDLPAVQVGYTDTLGRLRAGYSGLVLPGTCVSSYFVYSLRGVSLAASLPVHVGRGFSGRLYGSYLVAASTEADQEITWLTFPPGIRHWAWSRTSAYGLQGEVSYAGGETWSLLAGIRWESLITRFGNPNPDYLFTVEDMESGLSLNLYQPFVGFRLEQNFGSSRVLLRVMGLPVMTGTLEHFNTCNNQGIPFAHVGSSGIRNGYFLEAHGEIGLGGPGGLESSAFVTWELFRGTCPMNLERRDAGPPVTITSATVDFSYDRSSLTVGAKLAIPFALPF